MAHNEIDMDVPAEKVFAVLSDPRSFARWVVGSREIRRADPDWPAVGTAFDHKVPGIAKLMSSADHKEGPKAFAEKRKPVWKNEP